MGSFAETEPITTAKSGRFRGDLGEMLLSYSPDFRVNPLIPGICTMYDLFEEKDPSLLHINEIHAAPFIGILVCSYKLETNERILSGLEGIGLSLSDPGASGTGEQFVQAYKKNVERTFRSLVGHLE